MKKEKKKDERKSVRLDAHAKKLLENYRDKHELTSVSAAVRHKFKKNNS